MLADDRLDDRRSGGASDPHRQGEPCDQNVKICSGRFSAGLGAAVSWRGLMISGGGSTANRAAADVIGTPCADEAGACGACEAEVAGDAGPEWPACECCPPWTDADAGAVGAAWFVAA